MWIDDTIIARCREDVVCSTWVPESPLVVLGRSNQAARECNLEACERDGVPVLQRCGGGGTVVLYPGAVVLSLGVWVRQLYQNRFYFDGLNQALITTLARENPVCARLSQRGLSDIADGDKKIAGTSLFRSRNYLLYQVSLLVEDDLALIERYLPHPSSEPDYRQQKSHRQFLSSLGALVPDLKASQVCALLSEGYVGALREVLGDELIAPDPRHCVYLERKVQMNTVVAGAAICAET